AVVDAVQPELLPAVEDLHARSRRAVLVADRDQDRVDSARLAADDELAEHGGHAAVASGVADVVLLRRLGWGLDDELPGVGVPRRGRLDPLDVRPVARLAHREAAGQLERGDLRQ